jgi:hypothetical protein
MAIDYAEKPMKSCKNAMKIAKNAMKSRTFTNSRKD